MGWEPEDEWSETSENAAVQSNHRSATVRPNPFPVRHNPFPVRLAARFNPTSSSVTVAHTPTVVGIDSTASQYYQDKVVCLPDDEWTLSDSECTGDADQLKFASDFIDGNLLNLPTKQPSSSGSFFKRKGLTKKYFSVTSRSDTGRLIIDDDSKIFNFSKTLMFYF